MELLRQNILAPNSSQLKALDQAGRLLAYRHFHQCRLAASPTETERVFSVVITPADCTRLSRLLAWEVYSNKGLLFQPSEPADGDIVGDQQFIFKLRCGASEAVWRGHADPAMHVELAALPTSQSPEVLKLARDILEVEHNAHKLESTRHVYRAWADFYQGAPPSRPEGGPMDNRELDDFLKILRKSELPPEQAFALAGNALVQPHVQNITVLILDRQLRVLHALCATKPSMAKIQQLLVGPLGLSASTIPVAWGAHGQTPGAPPCPSPSPVQTFTPAAADTGLRVAPRSGIHASEVQATSSPLPAQSRKRAASASHICASCERVITPGNRCTGCKSVWYCNAECQKHDWPTHKRRCSAFKSRACPAASPAIRAGPSTACAASVSPHQSDGRARMATVS